MKGRITPFGAAAALVALTALSSAQQTQMQCSSLILDEARTPWTESVRVRQFDPALGALQAISIELEVVIDGRHVLENLADEGQSFTPTFRTEATLFRPEGELIQLNTTVTTPTFLQAFDGEFDADGLSGESVTYSLFDSSFGNLFTGWDQFTGLGFVPLELRLLDTSSVETDADDLTYHFRAESLVRATLTTCYTYIPGRETFCYGDGGLAPGCTPCLCGNDQAGNIGGCLNSTGNGARLYAKGISETGFDTLRFELVGGVPGYAILSSGDSAAPTNPMNPCWPENVGTQSNFLDGLRCVAGNVIRHGSRIIDENGRVGVTNAGWGGLDAPAEGILAQGGFMIGQTRHFQASYREDPSLVCGKGSNTTNGVVVEILF